jgi:NDP-sugar pyrophosphorylase family protein
MKKYALILAAGKGTRMRTELPKCAFPILKKPMIEYIIENIEKSVIDETIVVVGHKKEVMEDILKDRVNLCISRRTTRYWSCSIFSSSSFRRSRWHNLYPSWRYATNGISSHG